MKQIALTQSQVAIVDDEDFDSLSVHQWYALWQDGYPGFVAVRGGRWPDGRRRTINMAREIMNATQGVWVDHRNHDTLDNRRSNLRLCSHAENCRNRRIRKDNQSGYKGVIQSSRNRWCAFIGGTGKKGSLYLGSFGSPESAHQAYAAAAIKYHADFANTEGV